MAHPDNAEVMAATLQKLARQWMAEFRQIIVAHNDRLDRYNGKKPTEREP